MSNRTYEQVRDDLRKAGVRLTSQRQIVLKMLKQTEGHLTAEEIHSKIIVEYPGTSMATIYNTCTFLTDVGAIRELQDGRTRRYEGNADPHGHLICTTCGSIRDVELPEAVVLKPPTHELGFDTIDDLRLDYCGTCAVCIQQDAGNAS